MPRPRAAYLRVRPGVTGGRVEGGGVVGAVRRLLVGRARAWIWGGWRRRVRALRRAVIVAMVVVFVKLVVGRDGVGVVMVESRARCCWVYAAAVVILSILEVRDKSN